MPGSSWRSGAVFLAAMSSYVMADVTLTATDSSQYQEPESARPIQLALPDSASTMKGFAAVLPLFSSGYNDLQPWELSDPLFHVTTDNGGSLTSEHIAFISCDTSAYPGYYGASNVLSTALAVNVTAVLLYSTEANYCNLTDLTSSYPFIYTMTNSTASLELQTMIEESTETNPLHGLISFADEVTNSTYSTGSSQTQNTSSNGPLGGSPTTAVAMIILYSITGIITGLFLVIIVTGAVRAHRHPERYGPRNITGRPRQSRARGMGRAILDTIPIVKFGEREEPKVTDVEMASEGHAAPIEIGEVQETVVAGRKSLSGEDPESQTRKSTSSARSGIAPATTRTTIPTAETEDSEAPGCSICTEDFEIGEDLRVLPCDHKFHPACIDPWLLNISGTCPLCRIDLNPTRTIDSDEPAENAALPPPIDGGENAPRQRIGMRQSFLIGLGLGTVHDTTREERLAAVRMLREEHRRRNREQFAANESAAAADETSRRRRFRERFGIRTRQTGQDGETREEGNNS